MHIPHPDGRIYMYGKEMKQNKGKAVLSVLEEGDRIWFLDRERAGTDVMNRCREDRMQTWNYIADE